VTIKTHYFNNLRCALWRLALLGLCGALLSACGTRAVSGDGPGSFRAMGQSQNHEVRDLPRSRSGNASVYTVFGKQYSVLDSAKGFTERGIASWYGSKFHGRDTASGEKYNMYELTAAHKNLPLPVYVQVTNLDNGKQLIVKVNDRGPFVDGRIIDLSFAAARELGVYENGTANVEITALTEAYREGEAPVVAAMRHDALPVEQSVLQTQAAATPVGANTSMAQPGAPKESEQPRYGWVVQLGAFKDAANASTMREQLNPNLAVRSSINHDANKQLYRLIVGPMLTSDEADRLVSSLASAGIDGYTLKAQIK